MTRTQVLATMEAAQLQRYHAAYPHMTAMLSQMSDDDVKKALNPSKSSAGSNLRSRMMDVMMEPFLPPSFRGQIKPNDYSKGKIIKGMSIAAAKGLLQARDAGYLDNNLTWLTIYRHYPSIVKTAKRGDNS